MSSTHICTCVYLYAHVSAYTHRATDHGPVYRPVILLRYGLASGGCLATVIPLVVVTAVVAICRAIAQLLCPGFKSPLFFSVTTHTDASQVTSCFLRRQWCRLLVWSSLLLSAVCCGNYGGVSRRIFLVFLFFSLNTRCLETRLNKNENID